MSVEFTAKIIQFSIAWIGVYAGVRAGRKAYSDKDAEEYEKNLTKLDKLVMVGESFALSSIIVFVLL